MNLKLITLAMWTTMTSALTAWQSAQDGRITTGLTDVSNAITQALAVGGAVHYATEAALLAAAPGAAGNSAWAQDTAQWWRSDGTAWQLIGGGALSESSLGITLARYRASRTPAQNAAYLQSLLDGGSRVLRGPGLHQEWLIDRALRVDDHTIVERLKLKLSGVPFDPVTGAQVNNDTSNGRNGLIVNRNAGTASKNTNIHLRDLILDAGNYGSAGGKTRTNGWTLMNTHGWSVQNVQTRNGTGYGQWHPDSTYGTVRDCLSENFEECFEGSGTTRHVTYDHCRSVGGAGRTVTGFLMYAGASHVTFLACRAEGYGNGFTFSESDGDTGNIFMDAACSSDMLTGVSVSVGGVTLATYKPSGVLAAGYTEAADGTITRTSTGLTVYRPDQRITLDGRHAARAANALQSGTGGTPPRGLTVHGEWDGQHQGLLLLGAGGQSPRLRDVRVTVTARTGEATAPQCINSDMPLDADGLTVEIRGEANFNRRKLLELAAGSRARRVQGRGAAGFVQMYGSARATQIECGELIVGGAGNIVRGGSVGTLTATGSGNDVFELEVTAGLGEVGGVTGNRYAGLVLPAPATISVTAGAVLDAVRQAGTLLYQNAAPPAAPVFTRAVQYDSQPVTSDWTRLTAYQSHGSGWTDATDQYTAPSAGLYRVSVWLRGAAAAAGTVSLRAVDGAGALTAILTQVAVSAGAYSIQATQTVNLSAAGTLRLEIAGTIGGTLYNGPAEGTVLLIERIG